MSKGSAPSTQTTKSEPWEGQAPYLRDLYSKAQALPTQQFFPGQTYASPSDLTFQAEQLAEQAALGPQSTIAGSIVPSIQEQLMSPAQRFSDPLLQESLRAGLRPMEESASRLLQQARRDATQKGQLGGSRQGILESEVIKDLLTKQSDVASKLYGDVYGDALKSQAVAMQNIPTIMSGLQAPARGLQDIGNIRTARAQLPIDEAMNRFNFNQNANLANLQNYSNLIGSPIAGTTTQTAPGAKSGGLQGALGGAAAGSTFGPYGALIGGALGLFS